jgi:glucokinase
MPTDVVAGIDIGGTKIALALATLDGATRPFRRFPTETARGPQSILAEACSMIEALAAEAEARLVAIGVGCGGPLDRKRGLILSPPNLPGWDEFPIVRLLAERFDVPVLLDNDANAAALGEFEYGAGRGLRDIVYLTISTGIGGGVIVNGQLVHGVADGAGEIGHMVVLPDGPSCGCGARGCLEALCSGTSIARRAQERLATGAQSSLRGRAEQVTAQMVVQAAQAGDQLATEVWGETIHYLAHGLSNVISILAPEAIILGGGVSTAGAQLFEPLRRAVRARVRMIPVAQVQILQAALAGDSGIYGALILGRRAHALRQQGKADTCA